MAEASAAAVVVAAVVSVAVAAASVGAARREAGEMALFDEQGRKRIEAAIAAAEQRSAGEIVVATVRASEGYHVLRLLYGFTLGMALAAVLHLARPGLGFHWLTLSELVVAASAWFALGWGPALRRVLPGLYTLHAVERRARAEFFERGLFATRERSGVLIMLSELERKVVILGDSGIHARVQTSGWQAHVDNIVAQIRRGRAADGVCEVIAQLAGSLEAGVPRQADDRDELSNEVREEKT
jgi:putative membrane protein